MDLPVVEGAILPPRTCLFNLADLGRHSIADSIVPALLAGFGRVSSAVQVPSGAVWVGLKFRKLCEAILGALTGIVRHAKKVI
jgi:hypothetical protein